MAELAEAHHGLLLSGDGRRSMPPVAANAARSAPAITGRKSPDPRRIRDRAAADNRPPGTEYGDMAAVQIQREPARGGLCLVRRVSELARGETGEPARFAREVGLIGVAGERG